MIATTLTVPASATTLRQLLVNAGYTAPPETFAQIRVEQDIGNVGTIYMGVGDLSTTVFGAKLTNAATYPIEFGDVEYAGGTRVIKFIAANANDKIHILLR